MSLTQFLHFRNMSHLVTEKKLFFLQKKEWGKRSIINLLSAVSGN